jgi:hypothetical protein
MSASPLLQVKLTRFLSSVSGIYFAVFSALCIPTAGLIAHFAQGVDGRCLGNHWELVGALITGVLFGLLFIVTQAYVAHRRSIYDPKWGLRFQAIFDGMGQQRDRAALILLHYKKELAQTESKKQDLDNIDEVLDFLDDLGFYLKGGHLSPEVAHHHFYHWIRGYTQAAKKYIEACRAKEPARWNHIAELVQATSAVELSESNGKIFELDASGIERFLNEEVNPEGSD